MQSTNIVFTIPPPPPAVTKAHVAWKQCSSCNQAVLFDNTLLQLIKHINPNIFTGHLCTIRHENGVVDLIRKQSELHIPAATTTTTTTTTTIADSWKCDLCNFVAATNRQLISHAHTCHQRFRACQHCNYVASTALLLSRHMDVFHTRIKNIKCPLCDYVTLYNYSADRHLLSRHSKIRQYRCKVCNFKAYKRVEYKAHITSYHNINWKKSKEAEEMMEILIQDSVGM